MPPITSNGSIAQLLSFPRKLVPGSDRGRESIRTFYVKTFFL